MLLEKCCELIEICCQTANHVLGWQITLYCEDQGHVKETTVEIPWISSRLLTDSDTVQRQSSLENLYVKCSSISQASNRAVFQYSCGDCYVGSGSDYHIYNIGFFIPTFYSRIDLMG